MENLRGAAWMTLAMLGFAFEDMFIKLLAGALPPWQIVAMIGVGGATVFGAVTFGQGKALFPHAALSPVLIMRNFGELLATLAFVTAIALTPLSTASAILQATPLVVTLGAALFLREAVGWRRWTAILVGFLGVLLIIRPGLDAFDARSLFAVIAVLGLAIRDLATRRIPAEVSSMQLSFLAFLTLIPAACVLGLATDEPFLRPSGTEWMVLACAITLGVLAYYAIVAAMRVGEISFVTPFRYSRMLFALMIGMLVFDERPDMPTLIGAGLIVASGLFTLWRERKHRAAA